jgi:hypothetical protein
MKPDPNNSPENSPEPPELIPVDASASVSVATDGMKAFVRFTPPEDGGNPVTDGIIRVAVASKKIIFGIDDSRIDQLARNPIYHTDLQIAEGKPPANGEDAVINTLIRTEKDIRPKELPDGTVDYKDLGIIQTVREGDVLCEKIPATMGEPGMSVYGSVISAKPGKDIPLPAGKNTVPSEDNLKLLAACDGHADIVSKKIQVMNTFTVPGCVSNSSGNINFLGNIIIEGNVLTGFTVHATGNVTINGTVEGAVVEADGNIIIKEGVNGLNRGMVKAGGYVKTKYIQSGTVQAGEDVEASFILHSKVQSGGSVYLIGTKGTVVGGHITALKNITALLAGSRSSYVPTILEVGNDPVMLARSREIPKEIDTCRRDAAVLLRTVHLLNEHKKAGRITPDKLETLQRALVSYKELSAKVEELTAELTDKQEAIAASGSGSVNISGTAFPGVSIIIGAERMPIESKYDRCTFVRDDDDMTIKSVPLR